MRIVRPSLFCVAFLTVLCLGATMASAEGTAEGDSGGKRSGPRIEDTFVRAELGKSPAATVFVSISRPGAEAPTDLTVACAIATTKTMERYTGETRVRLSDEATTAQVRIPMRACTPWSPTNPFLYSLEVQLKDAGGATLDSHRQAVGLRTVRDEAGSIRVNGQLFYVRGTGERTYEIIEPLDRAGALKRLRRLKEYGFNAERHALYCPTETYLSAADEVGVFQQVEIASLYVHKSALARMSNPLASSEFARTNREWESMIRRARRHPSVIAYGMVEDVGEITPSLGACMGALYLREEGWTRKHWW